MKCMTKKRPDLWHQPFTKFMQIMMRAQTLVQLFCVSDLPWCQRTVYNIYLFSFPLGCLFVRLFVFGFFSQFKLKYLCILPIYSFIFTSKDSDLTLEIYVSITARKISFFQDVTSMKNLTPVSHYGKTPLKNFWVWATKTWYILFTEYVFTLFWVIELWAVNLQPYWLSPLFGKGITWR